MYNINWKLLISRILPSFFRSSFWVDWLYSLLYPLVQLHNQFLVFRSESIFELQYNAQTMLLEELLRIKFEDNTIKIINNKAGVEPVLIYPKAFGVDEPFIFPESFNLITPVILPSDLQQPDTGFDFTVEVPNDIFNDEALKVNMRALINKYNHSVTSFNIVQNNP